MGPKNLATPSLFHIKPKAYAEEEEMSKDERRRSKLPEDVAKDNPILSKPRPLRIKRHATKGSLPEHPKGNHKGNETAIGE